MAPKQNRHNGDESNTLPSLWESQAKLGQLKDDPEFAEMFEDLKTNGMQALMKYYNDPVWLAKLGSRLDGVAPDQPQQRPRPPPQAPPEEITSLLDAAKWVRGWIQHQMKLLILLTHMPIYIYLTHVHVVPVIDTCSCVTPCVEA